MCTNETNSIGGHYLTDEGRAQLAETYRNSLYWDDPRLVRFVRLRLVTDRGYPFWDVSYAHGVFLEDGVEKLCYVAVPFCQLDRKTWWTEIKDAAKQDGINIYKLRLWNAVSKLW